MEGTKYNDIITGTSEDDNVNAQSGSDQVEGLAGNDHVAGGEGSDVISGGEGHDVIFGDVEHTPVIEESDNAGNNSNNDSWGTSQSVYQFTSNESEIPAEEVTHSARLSNYLVDDVGNITTKFTLNTVLTTVIVELTDQNGNVIKTVQAPVDENGNIDIDISFTADEVVGDQIINVTLKDP
ncbi:calcium-binding protein, partial [Aliivibrio salmonicida]